MISQDLIHLAFHHLGFKLIDFQIVDMNQSSCIYMNSL